MWTLPVSEIETVSLTNFTGKVACTVFTIGCNLRCRYCYNKSLVLKTEKPADLEKIKDKIKRLPLKNIAITGGEPLVHSGLGDFLYFLKDLGFEIKLDTNGTFPERLKDILDKRLVDYVAVDIKAFKDDDFKYITRVDHGYEKVKKSITLLKESQVPFEMRYTVWKVPMREEFSNFFGDLPTSQMDTLYVQKFVSNSYILDKLFNPDVTDEDLRQMIVILSNFLTVKMRNA
ncbi:anaerobic ribonucleoside-triphosphate reductase activating protein [Calditerrivibrio sp.]|jgi:pyruvate formate lyase activating enzyme|uniref:anaerobic ribonucleoside-triphosphate reductase activating protein n=1 Tax=Calditerrivibrio sp. TaxID=2792612 RepID=UPI003D0E80E9